MPEKRHELTQKAIELPASRRFPSWREINWDTSPTTVVLDRQGEIAFLHVGQLNRSVLDKKVTPLLQ